MKIFVFEIILSLSVFVVRSTKSEKHSSPVCGSGRTAFLTFLAVVKDVRKTCQNVSKITTDFFVADEDDEESGGESGVTDDEGIEDDHEEGETSLENGDNDKTELHHRAAVQGIGKSGTCDTLIALCR